VVDGDEPVAVVPLHWIAVDRRLSGSGFGLTAPAIIGGAAEERARISTFVFDEVRALARRLGARRVEFALSPVSQTALAANGSNPFLQYGFADESGHSRVLDLRQTESELHAGLARDARQQIRKANDAGITARQVPWSEWLDDYYRLHQETYTRTGVTPHMREYFAGIAERLAPRGYSMLTAAFDANGNVLAFHNTARLGGGAMYHTGCSTESALRAGANYVAFWEALKHAKAAGCEWYELGEVFPGHTSGKTHGLTVFKSKFGGEVRPSFRAALTLPDDPARQAYSSGALYPTESICKKLDAPGDDYTDRLLAAKFALVTKYYREGRVVDLCCGSGAHALHLAATGAPTIGLDYSDRYISAAARDAREQRIDHAEFVCADATSMPLASNSISLLYCFSALYAMPRSEAVVNEVARVLRPGGHAILDFGNSRSLNALSVSHYTEWPPMHARSLSDIDAMIGAAGLEIVERRRFQILPLWADRPRWLWPLLHPRWKRVLKSRIAGRMLDEWLSAMPILRSFAFRHVIVCRRRG